MYYKQQQDNMKYILAYLIVLLLFGCAERHKKPASMWGGETSIAIDTFTTKHTAGAIELFEDSIYYTVTRGHRFLIGSIFLDLKNKPHLVSYTEELPAFAIKDSLNITP